MFSGVTTMLFPLSVLKTRQMALPGVQVSCPVNLPALLREGNGTQQHVLIHHNRNEEEGFGQIACIRKHNFMCKLST